MTMATSDEPEPPRVPTRWRLLATSGGLALAAMFTVWGMEPMTHLTTRAEFGTCMWLFAYAVFALTVFAFGRRPAARAARLLALGAALRDLPGVSEQRPCPFDGVIARRGVYRACGYISISAVALTAFADILIAAGALNLDGANFRLFTVVLLVSSAVCGVGRLLGVQAAAAELAERQMLVAARLAARESGRPTRVRLQPDQGARGA